MAHATYHGNRESVSRCGADRGVLPQIIEIVEVTAGAVPVVVDVPVIKQRRGVSPTVKCLKFIHRGV